MESLSHVAPSKEGVGCGGQTLGKNLLLQWLKQSHVQRVPLLLWGYTNLCLQNVHAHNSCSTENFTRGIQIREKAAFQWFKLAKCRCGSLEQNRSISQAKRLHQPRALLQTVNMLRRFQKSIPWPLLKDRPT